MRYSPPAGAVGATIAKLFGEEPQRPAQGRPAALQEDRRDRRDRALRRLARGPARPAPAQAAPGAPAARRQSSRGIDERRRVMRATVWSGRNKVSVENVPDPKILNARDAIVKISSTAICGSDLHLYDGYMPTMRKGDILGHEFMGEVVEIGSERDEPQGRRPRRRAVPDRLRRLQRVHARAVLAVRELQPERVDGREAVGRLDVRDLRLLARDRRLRRRAGRVRARAVRRRRADQDRQRPVRRAGPVPVRHLSRPATWAPRSATSSPATSSRSGAAARSASSRSPARICSAPSA